MEEQRPRAAMDPGVGVSSPGAMVVSWRERCRVQESRLMTILEAGV